MEDQEYLELLEIESALNNVEEIERERFSNRVKLVISDSKDEQTSIKSEVNSTSDEIKQATGQSSN